MNTVKNALDIIKIAESKPTKKFVDFIDEKFKGTLLILKILKDRQNDEITAGEIARKLFVSTARIAVALEKLKSEGYIEKKKSLNDARKTIVTLTDKGLQKVNEKEAYLFGKFCSFLEKLTQEEIDTIKSILNKI